MSFPGWLMFAGTEIANAARTVAYSKALIPCVTLVKNCYGCDQLGKALNDTTYTTPVADAAPWYDPDFPESARFLGMYPLSMENFSSATTEVTVGESIYDGGYVSAPRRKTREMRVTGMLLGVDQAGAESGLVWLKSVLAGSECGTCDGDEMCFFSYCPDIQSNSTQTTVDTEALKAIRHMRGVSVTEGPKVLAEMAFSKGGYGIQVEFIMVATAPYIYTEPVKIASANGTTLVTHKTGATAFTITTIPVVTAPAPPTPIIDPDCPPIPATPKPPSLTNDCGTAPTSFFSYAIYIPDDAIQSWRDGIIQLSITTGSKATRYLRARFLPRPLAGQLPSDLDPKSQCGSFVINYIPPNTKVLLDGMTERITYQQGAGQPVSGAHLVSGVGKEVFEWPLLTCGLGYYLIIDVDTNTLVNVSLSTANRE
jgi:hypothetical protein